MVLLAWFILAFTLLQLVVVFINLVCRSQLREGTLSKRPFVSVLIPARNEEATIGNILQDIQKQEYRDIEVIIFNDQSSDSTSDIVRAIALHDKRIRLVNSEMLPEGWLGKNWACHSLAEVAKGEYFLFVDADVRIGNGLIANAISYARDFNVALISIFPKQIMRTIGEKATVPVMNYILLTLLPLILVRKSGFSSLVAANGQFMLFNAAIYRTMKPHEKVKGKRVEDIEIARYLKRSKHTVACLVGDKAIQCRMYSNFREAVHGFSRNVSAYFGNSVFVASVFWLVTAVGPLVVLYELPLAFCAAFLVAYVLIRILVSIISEQRIADNLLFLIPQQISCGAFIMWALINENTQSFTWKDRDIE